MPGNETRELSEREVEILRLVARGASNKEIAQTLFISANTVKVHLRNIFAKVGATSRTEAAMHAVMTGLVEAGGAPASTAASAHPAGGGIPDETPPIPGVQLTPRSLSEPARGRTRWQRIAMGVVVLLLIGLLGFLALLDRQTRTASGNPLASTIEQPRWQIRASMPTARRGLAVAAYENSIYAIGGEGAQGVTGVVEAYRADRDAWEQLAAKPVSVADVGAGVIGGRIYVPGGRQVSGELTDVLEIYDPRLNIWERGQSLPVALSGYALVTLEGKLWLFGGWDGRKVLSSVYEYDPDRDVWMVDHPPMPTARAFAGAAVAGVRIFVMGGQDGERALSVNEVYYPNRGDENPWETVAPLPEGRFGMGIASVADIIHIVGGEGDAGVGLDALQYFPQRNEWQKIEGLSARSWSRLGLIPLGTHLYALGGELEGSLTADHLSYQAIFTVLIPLIR